MNSSPQTLQELVSMIRNELGSDKGLTHSGVDVQKISQWMSNYQSNAKEWSQYALWDKSRSYTRNLVDEGNGHYNLMVLCWNEGKSRYLLNEVKLSPIHDHSGSHCLMKVIDGQLTETTYTWPSKAIIDCANGSDSEKDFDQKVPSGHCMKVAAENILECNQVTYISDTIGLHRVENKTDKPAVSLHLYTPPYNTCQLFDEKTVTFITPENKKISVKAALGENLLDVAHANDIDLEGACECSLACSTCHVIVDKEYYTKLPDPTDEEDDMLDLAFGLTETSRLGCQIKMNAEIDGITVRIPNATRNVQQEKLH